jgi:hypothetical protein
MSFNEIANAVSKFNDAETDIVEHWGIDNGGSMAVDWPISKERNFIFLLSGRVLGELDLKFKTSDNTVGEDNVSQSTITDVSNLILSLNYDNTSILFYPPSSTITLDPIFMMTSTETTVTIRTNNYIPNDLLIPGGKNLIVIVSKGIPTDPGLDIEITRPSYIDEICPTCPVCPPHEVCPPCNCNKSVYITTIVILALIIAIFILFYLFGGKKEETVYT